MIPALVFLLSTITSFLLLPFLPIDTPKAAVDAEKIEAMKVGSKSTIFLPDGGYQYESVNSVALHKGIEILTMVSTLLGS